MLAYDIDVLNKNFILTVAIFTHSVSSTVLTQTRCHIHN